ARPAGSTRTSRSCRPRSPEPRSARRVGEAMSKAEFLADIRAARADLADVLARKDERTLAEAVLPGQTWTSKDLLAHLIGYDQAVLKAIADVRAGRKWKWGWTYPNFDDWNESQVGPRRGRSYANVRTEL